MLMTSPLEGPTKRSDILLMLSPSNVIRQYMYQHIVYEFVVALGVNFLTASHTRSNDQRHHLSSCT